MIIYIICSQKKLTPKTRHGMEQSLLFDLFKLPSNISFMSHRKLLVHGGSLLVDMISFCKSTREAYILTRYFFFNQFSQYPLPFFFFSSWLKLFLKSPHLHFPPNVFFFIFSPLFPISKTSLLPTMSLIILLKQTWRTIFEALHLCKHWIKIETCHLFGCMYNKRTSNTVSKSNLKHIVLKFK